MRLDAVSDPNFSYWHSASFNNDGTKVIFTDEWGGGTSARCRATDKLEWGADALFDLDGDQMEFASYYKMPAVQTTQENCVAHNSSLVPVPGRDILVQAWYQGGVSVIDFSDTANPVEIAYFDRGPINTPNPTGLNLGGLWSTYWYNGQVYGSEIARGFDTFGLTTSDLLSENELDAAREVQLDEFNAQHQEKIVWTPSFNVAGAYFDQAVRSGELTGKTLDTVEKHLAKAEKLADKAGRRRQGPARQRDPGAGRPPATRASCARRWSSCATASEQGGRRHRSGGGASPQRCCRRRPKVSPSTSAPHDASITLAPTPTVTHDDSPSVVSMSTRVIASVPWPWSRMRTL